MQSQRYLRTLRAANSVEMQKSPKHQNYIELEKLETKRFDEVIKLRNEIDELKLTAKCSSNQNQENQLLSECKIFEIENTNLRQAYAELEAKRCVEVEKMKHEISKLKANHEIQKTHMKCISKEIYSLKDPKQSMERLLDNLKEQNILCAEAHETLKVIKYLKLFWYFYLLIASFFQYSTTYILFYPFSEN